MGLVRKNLRPRVEPKSASHPWRIWVTLSYKRMSNGMPNDKDMHAFERFEADAIRAFEKDNLAVLVAVVTMGKRDYLFYASDKDKFVEAAESLDTGYLQYRPDIAYTRDTDWSQYFELAGD